MARMHQRECMPCSRVCAGGHAWGGHGALSIWNSRTPLPVAHTSHWLINAAAPHCIAFIFLAGWTSPSCMAAQEPD